MNKSIVYELTRNIARTEFRWLKRDFKKSEIVYRYYGPTYDCIGCNGYAFTIKPNELPFFELPKDSVSIMDLWIFPFRSN